MVGGLSQQQARRPMGVRPSRQKAKFPSPLSFYVVCDQVSLTLTVGLPASDNLTKKIPHRSAQHLVSVAFCMQSRLSITSGPWFSSNCSWETNSDANVCLSLVSLKGTVTFTLCKQQDSFHCCYDLIMGFTPHLAGGLWWNVAWSV